MNRLVTAAAGSANRLRNSPGRWRCKAGTGDWATVAKAPQVKVPEAATGPARGAGVTVLVPVGEHHENSADRK